MSAKSYQRNDWRAWPYAYAFGKRIVGDKASGALNELDEDTYSERGDPIRSEIILPDIPGKFTFDALELDVATGTGLNVVSTADGYNPQVMLRWSDDGGYTGRTSAHTISGCRANTTSVCCSRGLAVHAASGAALFDSGQRQRSEVVRAG